MFKVFVSYSTHDLKNVAELQQSLAGTGVELFVAEHSVLPSEHLSDRISSAISACDLFVVLWSTNAKASDWVSQEIGKAHSLNKKILPLVLTEGMKLPGFISDLKYIPLYKDPTTAIQQAQAIIVEGFRLKKAELECQLKKAESERQKHSEALMLLGLGALFFWALNQE